MTEAPAPAAAPAPSRRRRVGAAVTGPPRLARAEVLRLRSRRLVIGLLALGFAVLLLVTGIAFTQHARPTAADLAAARTAQQAQIADCQAHVVGPSGASDQACAGVPLDAFLPHSPFLATQGLPAGATAVAGGFAVLLLLVGLTTGGADWSAHTLTVLFTWEPRRARVVLTRAGVLLGLAVLLGVTAQVVWTGLGALLATSRGTWGLPSGFWPQLLGIQARGVLLGLLAAAGGYCLALLVRNTGAALGIAFVYLAIVENALRGFLPATRPYLLAENIAGLLTPGGITIPMPSRTPGPVGVFSTSTLTVVHLSNLRAGGWLALGVIALLALATEITRRRDLT
ncbi:MAG: hypothetical protein ACYCU5_00400 [Actinomycetes bacterium]